MPTIDASSARNDGFDRSSRCLKAVRKDGSCGNGVSGWMYVKKSSTSSSRIEMGQIDSALSTACEESDASVAATFVGLQGDGVDGGGVENCDGESSSRRRRLMLSA